MSSFSTEFGVLSVCSDRLTLKELDGTVIDCHRYVDIKTQEHAEEIAQSMHNLEGRFSDWRTWKQ